MSLVDLATGRLEEMSVEKTCGLHYVAAALARFWTLFELLFGCTCFQYTSIVGSGGVYQLQVRHALRRYATTYLSSP